MMNNCPICNRRHVIMWPQFWPYRIKDLLFCSDQCLDVFNVKVLHKRNGWVPERKQKGKKKKMSYTKVKKDGSPAKKSGPKPKKIEMPEGVDVKAVKVTGPIIAETPEDVRVLAMKPVPAATPVKHTDFEISAIRNSLGEFYFDKKYSVVDWRTIEGEEVSLSPAAWRELAEVVPDVLTVLGVGSGD